MNDYRDVLKMHPGLLVRQRLRLKNFCICCIENNYDIGSFPENMDRHEAWPDSVFKHHRGLMYAKEHSDMCDKFLCRRYRAFHMKIHHGSSSDGKEILHFNRPFKCPLVCCCIMPWPQEIKTLDAQTGVELGKTVQDWRCGSACCGRFYWKVYDQAGTVSHVLEQDVCCNENCFAPSCCCQIHKINIKDPHEKDIIGTAENIFPGCTLRTLICGRMIDNYRLTFPTNATSEDKANLLGALILVDFMVFANADDDKNAG